MKDTSRLPGRVLVLAACITAMLSVPAFATSGAKPIIKKGIYEWSGSGDIQVYVVSKRSLHVTHVACNGKFLSITSRQEGLAKIKNGQFVFHFHWDKTQKPGVLKGTFVGKRLKLTDACGKRIATFRGT